MQAHACRQRMQAAQVQAQAQQERRVIVRTKVEMIAVHWWACHPSVRSVPSKSKYLNW